MTDAKKPWEQQYGGGASAGGAEPWKQDYGPDAADAPAAPRGLKGWGQDIAATAVKGAIAVPEALVGLADIPTGGRVGKFLENEGGAVGFRPKQAKEQVNDWHSDATKEAQRKFQAADGIVDKAAVAIQNPSLIATAVGESLPSMGLGGVAARGIMAATKLGQMGAKGAVLAGAAGEGATMAGSQAEQIRQETQDGLLTPGQSGLALATGVAGAAFGVAGGKVAQRLGIGDAETMMAQGIKGMDEQFAGNAARAAANPLVADAAVKSIPRKVIEGAIAEGFLEELPQSMAEQIFQNIALGKPWSEELDSAMVMGVLSGGAMGAGAGGFHGFRDPGIKAGQPTPDAPDAPAGALAEPDAPVPGPGMQRVANEFAARLQALQEQEQGEAAVPQTAPPDGAAALAQQQAQAQAARDAEIAASRAVQSPDDEILASTGAAMRPSEAMGLRPGPAAGTMENAAAMAVDTGATGQMQEAAALAQAAEAADKGKPANQKQEQPAQATQAVDPDTGEISGMPSMADWSDADLSNAFRHAQALDVRRQLAGELSRRRALRDEAELQADLQAEQASADMPDAPDSAFARVQEDAGAVPKNIEIQGAQQQAPTPGSQAEGANVATLAQLNRKKLAEMSGDELQQLSALLPAEHSRQQKIQKAIQTRSEQSQQAINKGANTDGTQTSQAQQAGAQPAQAGTAQASALAAQGVILSATPTQHNGAQAQVTSATKSQPKSAQAAPAKSVGEAESIAKEGNAQREQERQRKLDVSERWTRMTTVERQAVTATAPGLNPIARKNLHTRAWADIGEKVRDKLLDSLVKPVVALAGKAQEAIESEAKAAQQAISGDAPAKPAAQPVGDEKPFAAESGTLGVPRADMPQVPTANHGGMVKHLNAQGIAHETTMVDAAELKPTQAEYSPSKVETAKSATGDRAVIVSSDGHIIDGHHQAVAAAEEGKQVKAIVLDAPVEKALEAVKASPSANAAAPTPTPAAQAASVQEPPDSDGFPMSEAVQSYSGISHTGRSRAEGDKQAFDKYMESAHAAAEKLAITDAQRDALAAATDSLRADYLQQYRSLMNARASTYSGFVAGRGNLNSKQANSRNSALDKAMERFDSWSGDNADRVSKAVLAARTPEQVKVDQDKLAASIKEKADKKAAGLKAQLLKFLSFKSGEEMPYGKSAIITKVSYDRDGYPSSLTFKMADGSPVSDDKLDLVDALKDKGETLAQAKARIRALVDEVRTENPELIKGVGAIRAAVSAKAAKLAPKAEPAAAPVTVPETAQASFLDRHNAIEAAVSAGTLVLDDFKSTFAELEANQDAVMAELQKLTKDQLLRAGGAMFAYRMVNEKKDAIVQAAYQKMLDTYALGRAYGSSSFFLSADSIAKNKADKAQALREMVVNTTAEDLAARAAEIKAARDEFKAKREAQAEALANPKTLQDFRGFMSHWTEQGDTRDAAFLRLSPEQRQQFDALEADQTKEQREAAKRRAQVTVASAGNTTAGEIIATKHTKHGHDLFVVQLADRVERDAYDTLNSSAKRMGGNYSSFRGNGAVPGFQFRTREAAEAFQKLVAGDTAQAEQVVNERRDAFADDKSQTAVERLRTMAEALDQGADEQLNAERKTNTARRARMANAAEDVAHANKAFAGTMRNVADAIEADKAQFLSGIRTKSQLSQLLQALRAAKIDQLMAKHGSWAAVEDNKHAPMDSETVDFAKFPRFEMFRSDLANLARQLLEIEGGKKMGAALARVADDVTQAYTSWAKENLLSVSHFGNKTKGGFADYATKEMAERAIRKNDLVGKAVVLPVKRGQNRLVLSPGEAMQQGLWQGDGDKRIQLGMEFVEDLAKLGKRKGSKVLALPWQLESTLEKRQRLQRMGIQTPAEYRSALRELQSLRQERAEPDRIKELERAMVGRASDGLDFFPTSQAVVQSMLDAAEITEGMAVLEPSAGMGHIADAIVAESGVWPDVVELSGSRRELLEAKGFQLAAANDFLEMQPRGFYTYGDTFRAPDGAEGIMRGMGGLGSQRVRLEDAEGNRLGLYDRDELTGIALNGAASGYDRIIMNPPFSDGRDIQHVQHAYSLLRPGGRIVAIMGEGAFFHSNKRAEGFREWLDERGATNEKLPEGSFMDPSLPVNTGVAARMVVIDKPAAELVADGVDEPSFRRQESDQMAGADFDVASFLKIMDEGQLVSAATEPARRLNVRPSYSPAARAEAVRAVTGTADAIRKAWANGPEVIVAFDMQDPVVPESARRADLKQRSGGAQGAPEGFYYQGKVYLMASKLKTPNDAARVLFHEALGHHGLRGLFGKELGQILNQVAAMRKADVDAKIEEYGLRRVNRLDRRTAAEEVLAEMAQNTPQIGFVRRAVAAIRTWLRTHVPGFKSLALTDAELIRSFILPARAWVERAGFDAQAKPQSTTFSRSPMESVNRADADVMFSRSRFMDLKDSALDQLSQTFTHEGKVSLWDKSVGTMRHLGERAPAFKPVYEAASQNIEDVSMLANDAADAAPRLIPRVESLRDMWGKDRKKPVSAADNKAVAKPLFEGTLIWVRDENGKPAQVDELQKRHANLSVHNKAAMLLKHGKIDSGVLAMWQGLPLAQFEKLIGSRFESKMLKAGIVWSDSELQSMFGANANQISLYREARAAIDRSIDMTARTDMLRVVGEKYEPMRDAVLAQPSVEAAAQLLLDTLEQDAKADPDSRDRLAKSMELISQRLDTAVDLQKAGYAPLSRFGRYTVDVVDASGERLYFGMYETARDSHRAKMQLAQEFNGATITTGTMSAEAYKLFAGVTPETLEQFGEMLGLKSEGNEAQDKAFQEFLKLTKNNHSAMKRMIHRQGIAGFSEDMGRVVANFVYSNARAGAMGLNAGKMDTAIGAIPKEQGELKDLAMGLRSYIRDPQEEGQAVRGMLFAQYLGGSLASAFVNMTQPFQITMPWLSQYGGMKKAGAQMARALKDMGTKGFQYEDDLAKALQAAEDDGTVSPQEVHQLMAQARGAGGLRSGDGTRTGDARAHASNLWEKGKVLWGQPFALAEQFNRRSTFIASYRIAKDQGMADPAGFARKAVLETQFVYTKANKPKWARGAVGGTLFTFKTYSVSYLELMQRMWTQGGPEGKRAVGWTVAMLLLMSGAGGLPFMEDAEDLIDGAGQLMGYNLSSKQWRKELMADAVGKELADFMEQGISGLPGAPIDVSGRMGMGNLIPGTGLFMEKQNRMRDLLEIAGPAGDLVARGFSGARKALTGDFGGAALEAAPTAVRNAAKGINMATSGIYKDTKGYKVMDVTMDEALAKFIGFQPKAVAEDGEASGYKQRTKSFYIQTSSDIKAQWAQAVFNKDDAALQRVRDRLDAWNRNNPDMPITVKIPEVMRKVREMGKDRSQRIVDNAPKALRAQMREMAAEASR